MDSKNLDAQSGHEFTLTAIIPALAGANMIYGVGMLDSALTWDYASALLQNEFIEMVLRVVNGIQVSDETFAMDVIRDVGPAGDVADTYIRMYSDTGTALAGTKQVNDVCAAVARYSMFLR